MLIFRKNWMICSHATTHVRVICDSHTCSLCDSLCFSYTQDLMPNDSSLCLDTKIVEILRVEVRVFSLNCKWRMTRPKKP